ncbi:MAG: RidA family protein, partial [Vicinamibacterales bacterium]
MRLLAILALSLGTITMTFAQSSSKHVYPGANPAMPFSAAVKADGLIYVSGTLGSSGDIKAQTKQVLDNINATLKTAGSSLANAASVTVYLRNQGDFAAMNEVYRGYWAKDPPARTTVM